MPVTSAPNANWLTRDNPSLWAVGLAQAGRHLGAGAARSLLHRRPARPGVPCQQRRCRRGRGPSAGLSGRPGAAGAAHRPRLRRGSCCSSPARTSPICSSPAPPRAGERCRSSGARAPGQGRLVRQLLTESLVLSLIGGVRRHSPGALGHRRAGGRGPGRIAGVRDGRDSTAACCCFSTAHHGVGGSLLRRDAGALCCAHRHQRLAPDPRGRRMRSAARATSATHSSRCSSRSASCFSSAPGSSPGASRGCSRRSSASSRRIS